MAGFVYTTSTSKYRKCRICDGHIVLNTWAIMLKGVHVSPHRVNLFFHEGCFMRSLSEAAKCRNELLIKEEDNYDKTKSNRNN